MAAPTAYPLPFVMEAWDNRIEETTGRFMHLHGGCELMLIRNPGAVVIHRGGEVAAPPGTLFLHHPDEEHGIVRDGAPTRLLVVNYEPDARFEAELPGLAVGARRVWHLDDDQTAAYTDLVTRIQMEMDGKHPAREQAASALLRMLLILVGRLDARAETTAKGGMMQPVDADVALLRRAIDLRRQGSSTSALHELVDNYDSLRHRFRRTYGESPNHMLMRLRIEYARGYLSGTDKPIAEIAKHVGYGRQHEFARAFHRIMGCTPSAFRRQHRRAGDAQRG